MRFRGSQTPPPWLNRRDQFRLLRMVGLLVLVMVAVKLAADPSIWRTLLFMGEPQQQSAPSDESDRRTTADKTALRDDEFRSQNAPKADVAVSPAPKGEGAAAGAGRPAAEQTLSIDPAVFVDVEDDFVGLRAKEADAFYHVLDKAAAVDQEALQAAAARVDYAVLMDDPRRFRGTPLTVEGELKGLTKTAVPPNDAGIETVYEAWLFNRDSWPNPYCIRCLEVPEGIPMGSRISQTVRVRVTGYFFKNFGYASEGGFSKAPMVLAERLEWLKSKPAAHIGESKLIPWLAGIAGAIGLILAVAVWRFLAGDRKFEETHLKRLTAAPPEAIDALSGVEQVDPGEIFRRMSSAEISNDEARRTKE
ncbi:MAG: hypothetical protein KY476_00295 [Planctomycetes bacterium]|nr:hypothetical protein [Planctomycetota bacterium]